jgi:hypothetical protein
MTKPWEDWAVHYRSKGIPGDRERTCAIALPPHPLQLMDHPERVIIELKPLEDGRRLMVMQPHPEGYKVNFKPGQLQGEINIAWKTLNLRAPYKKGKLLFEVRPFFPKAIFIDISSWKKRDDYEQPTLFEEKGRILLPNLRVAMGGFDTALDEDEEA